MEWVWPLYRPYILRQFDYRNEAEPSEEALMEAFLETLGASTVTVLVQVPWQNSVRFKTLARYPVADAMPLLNDPEGFLLAHFGGGKFKLNFHRGWHFVATQNFKPDAPPKWEDLPDLGRLGG